MKGVIFMRNIWAITILNITN